MQILLGIAFIAIFFKPLDKFIKGKNDLIEDSYKLTRGVLVAFALFLKFMFLYFLYQYFILDRQNMLYAALLFLLILTVYSIVLLVYRNLYNSRYSEDHQSFTYKTIFRNELVYFKDLEQISYYSQYRGGRGYRLKDKSGKKYTLPKGFFNMLNLEKYIGLNSTENPYFKLNKWIDLKQERIQLEAEKNTEKKQLWTKIQSRLYSESATIFKPRREVQGQGVLQKPSRAFIIPIVVFAILLLMMFVIVSYEIRNNIQFQAGKIENLILAIILGLVTVVLFVRSLMRFLTTSYYEEMFGFKSKYLSHKLDMKFAEMERVIIKKQKIYPIKVGEANRNAYISTGMIIPEGMIEYLVYNFELAEEERDGTLHLESGRNDISV